MQDGGFLEAQTFARNSHGGQVLSFDESINRGAGHVEDVGEAGGVIKSRSSVELFIPKAPVADANPVALFICGAAEASVEACSVKNVIIVAQSAKSALSFFAGCIVSRFNIDPAPIDGSAVKRHRSPPAPARRWSSRQSQSPWNGRLRDPLRR